LEKNSKSFIIFVDSLIFQGEILYVFNILKEIEVPLSLININESEEFQ